MGVPEPAPPLPVCVSGGVGDGHLPLPGPPGAARPWVHFARGLEGRGLLSEA